MRYSIAILVSLFAFSCSPAVAPTQDAGDASPTPTPAPALTIPAEDEARSSCSKDCAHLRALGCPAAADTPRGGTCEAVCANEADAGVRRSWTCRTAAKSCGAIDACR